MERSRRGGILCGLLGILTVLMVVALVSGIRVEHSARNGRAQTEIDTPLGALHLDARENFNPESVGVPVYPGAVRTEKDSAGALVDFDWGNTGHDEFSVLATKFTTTDSADQVRAFYQARLPHGIVVHRRGRGLAFAFSREGYKRIVAIDQGRDRTYIQIAALGGAGAN